MAYSVKERCQVYTPDFTAWLFYGPVMLYLGFFLLGVTHEFAHGLGSGLTGGTFGFASTDGNIIGGYGLKNIYLVMPVFYVGLKEVGSNIIMLLAGPLSSIAIGAFAGLALNQRAMMNYFGSCKGRNLWMKSRGFIWGLLIRGWFDAVYIGPIDVFPGYFAGDGMLIHNWMVEHGYAVTDLFGLPMSFSAGHVIMAGSMLVMAYATYRLIKCTPTFCTCQL